MLVCWDGFGQVMFDFVMKGKAVIRRVDSFCFWYNNIYKQMSDLKTYYFRSNFSLSAFVLNNIRYFKLFINFIDTLKLFGMIICIVQVMTMEN